MATVTKKDLSGQLSRRLANFKLSDRVISSLADRVLVDGWSIARFDPCIYGICIDYFTDRAPKFDQLNPKLGISKWEVFPYGIIEWDRFRIRVAFEVDELEGRGLMREFSH
ncbi:MAG: hypothetical protein R2712_03925 [Vicinamibacterales bacterium]